MCCWQTAPRQRSDTLCGMIAAALLEIAVWLVVLGAAVSSRAWLVLAFLGPVALWRIAVSLSALGGDKLRDKSKHP